MSTISEQIVHALDQTGVSIRELARRLAVQDGTVPEAKRRWLMKILSGDIASPEPGRLRQIEAALGVEPGSLQAPPRTRRVAPSSGHLDRVISLLERNPQEIPIRDPQVQELVRAFAAEIHGLAARLDALLADGGEAEENAQ